MVNAARSTDQTLLTRRPVSLACSMRPGLEDAIERAQGPRVQRRRRTSRSSRSEVRDDEGARKRFRGAVYVPGAVGVAERALQLAQRGASNQAQARAEFDARKGRAGVPRLARHLEHGRRQVAMSVRRQDLRAKSDITFIGTDEG